MEREIELAFHVSGVSHLLLLLEEGKVSCEDTANGYMLVKCLCKEITVGE